LKFSEKTFRGPAMLEEKIFQASLVAALPQNFACAENFRHTARDRDNLILANERVQLHGEMRLGGKAAADAHRESNFLYAVADASRGRKCDIVDFRIAAPGATACDGNLEFAGQIVEFAVAAEFAVNREGKRRGIDQLVAVDSGNG